MMTKFSLMSVVSFFSFLLCGSVLASNTLTIDRDTTLTQDHIGIVVITVDNVTLDCDGRTIRGDALSLGRPGITLDGRTGVTVRNCVVTNFGAEGNGFSIQGSQRNIFIQNQVSGSRNGFKLGTRFLPETGSNGNLFIGNTVSNNAREGFDMDTSNNNFFKKNVVIGNGTSGIELDSCNNNVFENNLVNDNGAAKQPQSGTHGFSLDDSVGNVFTGNIADNNEGQGFRLQDRSNSNTLVNNVATRNRGGDAGQGGSIMNVFLFNSFLQPGGL